MASTLIGVSVRSVQKLVEALPAARTFKPVGSYSYPAHQPRYRAATGKGGFSTINDIRSWVNKQFGICYTQTGMWRITRRLGIKKKTARPRHVLRNEEKVVSFKKSFPALIEGHQVWFEGEMRFEPENRVKTKVDTQRHPSGRQYPHWLPVELFICSPES